MKKILWGCFLLVIVVVFNREAIDYMSSFGSEYKACRFEKTNLKKCVEHNICAWGF